MMPRACISLIGYRISIHLICILVMKCLLILKVFTRRRVGLLLEKNADVIKLILALGHFLLLLLFVLLGSLHGKYMKVCQLLNLSIFTDYTSTKMIIFSFIIIASRHFT